MASLIDKIASIFKPKKDTISVETTQGNKKTGTVDFSTSAPAKTTQASTPKTTPAAQAFKPAQVQTTQATGFYTPTGSLAQRAYKRDLAIGNVSATTPEKNNSFFSAYYKVLDDPKYSKMYTDLEKLKAGSNAKNGKDFKAQYDSGLDNLDAEIKAAKKQYGKNSDEYRALQQFKEDYTKLGSQIQANYSYKDSQKLSRQLDNTIDTVFAGYTSAPGYQQKVEKGKDIIEKVPDVAKRFNHDMKGASDKQMNLLYAVAADEGITGARDFYDRFLNPTVSRIGALRDFSSGISSNGKVQRVFSAAGGAAAGAVANSAIIGDGVEKGIDVLTGKAKALDDDVLAGDFTVQDSVDNLLRSEFAGINQADLDQYGNATFDQMSATLPGSDWLQDADEDATDYQKQLLGYVYLASDGNEEAAKGLWESIKARDSEIRQTVNGSTYGSTSQNAVKSQLYQEYLDKNKLMLGLYKSVVTTGSQLDRTLLSFIPVIGTALSLGVMGLDVYGKTYSEDILNGRAEDGKTAGHAATAALLEVAMEKLLGGLNHIPGLAIDEVSKRFVKNLANPWARGAVNTLLRLHGEGTEEALTDVANAISTGLWFGEGNIAQRVKQGFEDDFDAQQMLESYIYGAISAFFLGGMSTVGEIHTDFNYRELGQHLNTLESTDKLIDTILNTEIDEKAGKLSKKLYGEAKELAQGMKDGKLKKNDVNVGEMFANFAKSGGDVQWLTNPDTVNYNKDTLTEENFIAGATSRLAELGADTSLAGDIARWAMGQAPSQEAFNKIKSDPRAAQVLQELINPLDMEQDNALTRAAQSTTRNVTGDKTYDTLVASNPDQTVVNPATQQLISLGVKLEEAQDIGDVIAKVMAGETITETEAELVSVSNAAVRSVLSSVANVELAEDATIGAVMDALNGVAAEAAKTKEQQAAVAEGAEAAARVRMPIPPNTSGTVSMAGVEMTHDQFIESFMQKPGATLEQAEEAWNRNRTVSAALNGEEENNGTTSGKQEGRNPDLAGRSPIPAATQRTAESGRAADTGGTEQSGRVAESGQSADLRRGYTDDQVITAFNSKQRAFMRSCLDAGFKNTKLIKGPIIRQGVDKDGNPTTYEVNALVDDDGNLVIRWDNPYASPLRVALHERVHLWLSSMPDSERAAFVKQALQDIFGDNTAAFDAMYKAYADVYAKAYTGLTGEAFAAHVMEEMLADMYAGMNNYGANAGSYQSQAEMYVQQSGLREKFFGEEGGFSFDEQFSLNDPFRGDVDRSKPPETRPFPGEKAMHDNMELLSLTSMAQGANFELRLNSQGQPYELIDKKTGKRVEHVTGEMMIDTPLGNIVQLAVDNGNIDADEAAQQRDMLASAMNLIVDYDDAALVWELVGSQMFSAVKANSDKQYNKTIDFSTICKKTMAIVDAMSETMKKLGRGLTRREVEIVYEEVGKKGLATPCPVCYVFSRWMGIGGLLDQMNRFQVKYGDMSEEEIVAFMTRIENEAYAYAKKNPKSTYWDKNGNFLIGKVISDMKSGPNSKAASAIETLNAHQQALATIAELEKAKEKATPAMAKKYGEMIRQLRYNVKSEKALAEAEAKMRAAEAGVEQYEEYQWLAKTMMISDSSQVNEDGESVGNWKRNPNFKPVPQDILFDLNKGGEFAKDYPLSWAFRTGKGCAAGKAIAPYSDARVGETIQGVATDVKNIRVELDESQHDSFVQDYMQKNNATKEVAEEAWQNRPHNEFLTGDTKTQQKTLKTARKKQRQQNLIGGMRYQSTSDFRYEFGSDYLMTFLEMQALGANVQLYTKVIEAVDFLASTGADCNLSVMPLGDGYEEYIDPKTGEKKQRLIFSDITGINADAAIKKSQEYDNVQLILVGINDTNIRLALEGDEVTFVIPFHGSGQSVHKIQGLMDLIGEHLDVTKAQDYTSVQSDRAIKDRAEKHPELQAMWDLRMDIIMGKFLTEEQKETLKAWENAASQEEKTALANRLAELGKAQEGLSAEQKARLAKNKHLQKLYNMFYVDTTDPAFYNNLAKDQAEHIFPYEYWIKDGDYAHADENGRVFQEYCASIGVIPRFSGINSKYQKTGFGDFTQDKGYWKLLIDRSMYENVYDEKGNWIGYGKYRPQQQINMTNIDIGDLNPETGKAQFQNGEMSKQYDATRNPEDLAKRDNIVSDSIKRIEAMRGSADVVERNALDRTRVKKGFREKVMKAQSALRENERASVADVDNGETSEYTENISVDRTEDAGDGFNRGYDGNAPRSETQRAAEGSSSSNDGRRISPRFGKKSRIEEAPDWGSFGKRVRSAIVSDVASFLDENGTEESWEIRTDYRTDADFVADLYKNTYQKSGGNRTLFETYAKGYTTEPGNLFKAFENNINKDARTETGDGRFDLVERYSLAPVAAVEPKSDSWNRTHTTEEAMEIYPDLWNVSAEESETRNPTQIASTQGTYRNIYKILQDQGFDGKILDASSGLGIGTQIGRDEFGFDVEDIEPYPGENYSPMYTDYSKLNNKYDAIISSAVLNVLPQDQRDALVVKMGELLNDGGKMYITTRGKDVDSLAKTGKNIQLGPMEWIETVRGSYQKGFTQTELKAYLEDALGPGFTVELSNKSNGGKFNNNTSIVVTKNGESAPTERYSAAPTDKNPFPEGSAEQQMLDMMNKADNPDALEDYINKLIEKRNQSIEHQKEIPPALPRDTLFPVNSKQKEIAQNQLDSLIKKYGLLQKGEKAARDKSYPERTSETQFVRRTARTAAEAAGIPEYFADQIDQAVLNELLTYTRITDKMANNKSDKEYSDLGYKKAIKEWNENRASTNNRPSKYDIAFGERLLIEASRNNDAAVAMKVLADLAAMATQAGQVVQAVRMLKDMGPIGQLYYVQKAVDRINKDNAGRIAKGSFQPITIDQKLAEAVVLSNTQQEMEDNMKVLIKSIADQLPVTLKDKWDAWRYLAMLGNPRTHVRNVFGNAIFVPVRFVKDALAAAGEQFIDPSERTKSVGAKLHSAKYADVREYAKQDFKNMEPYITTGGKMNPLNEIMEARTIFKTPILGKTLETLRRFNDWALKGEDIIFLRGAYIDAFTQFVAARGLTAEQLTGPDGGATLNEARQYAALEAQKATYRDFSRLATALNGLRKTPGLGLLLDGLLPFTKTPINILKRGIEYSPAGLAKGAYDALFKVRRGDITAAQAIDEMAAGLTGTGVAILGYILASMGLARGADDDDKKKQELEEAQGHQSYSLEIGDNSYTIDWAAPVALPFFVGVEAHKQLVGDGEGSFWDFCNAMTLLMEPMMSLSMLDGINSTLTAVKSDQNSPIWAVLSNILASYVSQGAPTIGGQIARTLDPDRRSTYVDKNIEGPALLQRTLQGIQGKVPGLAKEKMAYVDVWGRKDTSSSALWRAFENFASPGYGNKIKETPVDTELMRLYDATGDNSVLPSTVAKYFQVEGERLDLTAKQYEKYKATTGQTAFKLIGELIDDPVYGSMSDAQKAETVKQLLDAAVIIGKQEVAPNYKGTAWVERAVAQDNLETAAVFHTIKAQNTGLSSYQLIESMAWLTPEEQGKLIMSERSNTERKMTDYKKKKYKFILTDEQIAREREIYNGMFWPAYNELIYSPKFLSADVAARSTMISKMQTDLNKASKSQLGDELRAEGYTSVLEDDSDVPEQPVDLYSLLNRG